MIETAIEERADRFEVRYHPTAGHPTRITLDFDHSYADDEVFVTVSALEIVARAN